MSDLDTKSMELDPLMVERVYEELGRLNVTLDSDPLSFGPKRLNNKVAEIRSMLSRCENLFLQVSQDRHRFQRAHRILSTVIDLAKKRLYDKDPEVRAGKSLTDRDAIATGKLSDEVREAHRLEVAVQDLDALLVVIRAKRMDLRDTEGRLRDQVRLCSEEIGLGGRWGSQIPNAPDLVPGQGRATGADVKEVEDLLARIDGEIHLPPIPESTEDHSQVPEKRLSLARAMAGLANPPPDEPEEPDEEKEAEEDRLSFESKGPSEIGSSAAADSFMEGLSDLTDKKGRPRVEPLSDDVLESLFDSF